MTKQEAAIVSAYTGTMLGDFVDMTDYMEELVGRPIWTHELSDKAFVAEVKELAKSDFINMEIK